ncbi:hypothetical protein [uncultured Cytophaga sp.]|uniref:hypothetical protein n=1 Tax=uncultured Cytophaga sp. TaxID=160238 RepID=UPI00260FAD68|nr:hypothetical protein [uncultured Cytophaga sp.]
MKKQFLLPALILSGIVAFTSCKKKDNDNAVNPSIQTCMVNYATNGNDSIKVTYDNQNRVTKYQLFDKSNNDSKSYSLFTYTTNKIIEKQYDDNSEFTNEINYYLNANQNVGYSMSYDGSNVNEADTTWYTYNANQQNTRRVVKNTSSIITIPIITYDTIWYTYSGNNISKVDKKIDNGNIETTVYSYGTVDAKSEFLAPEQGSVITNLYGKTSEKLPISKTEGSNTSTYVYNFNSEGYVIRAQTLNGGNVDADFRIAYNCK